MARQYDKELVNIIREKQYVEKVNELKVLVKPIPDGEHEGEMDPRIYKGFKKMSRLMRFMPKSMFEMNEKNIARMRKMFNNVDSTPMVTSNIKIDQVYATAEDGYKIGLKVYRKDESVSNLPILYYIHGGGFFAGSSDVVEEAMKLLVQEFDVLVFSVDYRLAPEHKFPTGHTDVYTAYKWVIDHGSDYGGDIDNVFVSGDSAGGNLCQYTTNRSVEEGLNNVKGQMLLYPTVNIANMKDEYTDVDFSAFKVYDKQRKVSDMATSMMDGATDGLLTLLGTDDFNNIAISPYVKVNAKLPPTMINVGEFDGLRNESFAFARKLLAKGVDVTTIFYRGMTHAYLDHVGNYPQAEDCVLEMGQFIEKYSKKN